jgi:ADP-ribose pyrophosphatase
MMSDEERSQGDSDSTVPRRLSRTVVYESSWVNLYLDRVEYPTGAIVEKHHLLDFDRHSVAVLVENEEGEILFVRAYRYTSGSAEWELPAGRMEYGEEIIEAARREVLEESGYQTEGHEHYYSFSPMNGIANQVFHLVRCRATALVGEFDRNEVQEYGWYSRDQIMEMIRSRSMKDGYSLVGLLLHFQGL